LDYLATHASVSPIRRGFAPGFVNYKKGALDSQPQVIKVYQLLAHGWWFYPGTPASSTTKTGRHYIAEILLKVVLNTKNQKIQVSRNILCVLLDRNMLIINYFLQEQHTLIIIYVMEYLSDLITTQLIWWWIVTRSRK
jgi:hypothetical protein